MWASRASHWHRACDNLASVYMLSSAGDRLAGGEGREVGTRRPTKARIRQLP